MSDLADVKAKMQQLVLLRDRVLFAPTAAGMIPDTPFAGALEDVASWLRRHGLSQYVPTFRAAAVTPQLCEILDENGWAELWAGELTIVAQQDRLRLMQALPDLLSRGQQPLPTTNVPTFGAPAAPAPVAMAPAPAGALSPGGYSVPTAAVGGSAIGSNAATSAAPFASTAPLNVRVLLSAEPSGEFSPPGSQAQPSVIGHISVPTTISSFAEARSAVEAQLAGKLPPSFVFVRHGAPVGKKQEMRWPCELSPTSLDLVLRGKVVDTPTPAPAAFGEPAPAAGFAFGQQSAGAPVAAASSAPATSEPAPVPDAALDMFGGMEIAGDDFLAEMGAISAAAPPPVTVEAPEPEAEFTGGIKRGGKKKRKAKAKAAAVSEASAPAMSAFGAAQQQPAVAPAPAPPPIVPGGAKEVTEV
eukprot:COSAG06_NODE_8744_length_2081_cov_1.613017_2_plen_414_part_01